MIIALIHWRIEPSKVDEFLNFWRTRATIEDRTELIGEFLNRVCSKEKYPYITWSELGDPNKGYVSFVNVALWKSASVFYEQVAKNFNDTEPPLPFEKERRVRTVLESKCWRMGDGSLPRHDSGGVL